jgi:hypothetical protein
MIRADVLEEARRLTDAAGAREAPVRLLGGTAIMLRAGERVHAALRRTPVDIDFVAGAGAGGDVVALLSACGYRPDEAFNRLEGARRLLFHDDANGRQVDVFVRDFAMCHTIPIGDRLLLEPVTLPLAELLLTKLQIVELNAKDRQDIYALLQTHQIGERDGALVNGAHVARVCARDWGLHRTVTLNLARIREHLPALPLDPHTLARIGVAIEVLSAALDAEPKSRGWRLRSRLGERVRWYDQPDDIDADRRRVP